MAENLFGYIDTREESEVTYNATPLSTAPGFDTTTAYNVGDYCFYQGALYRFVTAKSAGAWDATCVESAVITEDMKKTNASKATAITETVSGSIVSIEDGADGMPVQSLTVSIEPVQSGSGDPSPDNVRPITGFDSVHIYHSDADTSDPDVLTVSLSSAGTVYCGPLDVTNGVLTVTKARIKLLPNMGWSKSSSYPGGYYRTASTLGIKSHTPFICSHAKTVTSVADYVYGTCMCDGSINIRIMGTDSTLQDWQDYLTNNDVYIVAELSSPQTYQLTPEQILMFAGKNKFWSDAGDVEITHEYNSKAHTDEIEKLLSDYAVSAIDDVNLLDGYYINSSGSLVRSTSISASDFIPVNEGDVISYCLSGSAGWSLLATYDENQAFLERIASGAGWSSYQEGTYTVPEDVSYVRFCFVTAQKSSSYFMLTRSSFERISKIESRLTELESGSSDILSLHPSKEMLPIFQNLKFRLRDSSFNQLATQLVFCHFTDIHGDQQNLQRIADFCEEYSSYIDTIIHTGDSVYDRWSDSYDFWTNVSGSENIMNVIGNHDVKFLDADNNPLTITQKEVYDRYFAPFISNWGVTQPDDAATNGLMYYYKDYTASKIRLIVLDCMYNTTDQTNWLTSVLADARTNDYAVVIAEHYPIALTQFEGCAFTALDPVGEGSASTFLSAQQAVDSFINDGGEFVMWLCGHTHKDFTGKITAYPNQFMFVSDLASMSHIQWGDTSRTKGEKSQDLFNLIGIDRATKTVRVYRIGADYDRYLRHKVSMVVDYQNAKLVWSS